MSTNRVAVLIDGFNLYHSVRDTSQPGDGMRWLDVAGLCRTLVSSAFPPPTELLEVHYFSALAHHREAPRPGTVKRHQDYISAIEAKGATVHLGRFKQKPSRCRDCGATFLRHEEKETDVAIAAKLIELAATSSCDTVVIMTGDTDMIPAIQTVQRQWPECKVFVAFPYNRHNADLARVADGTILIRRQQYLKHRLPDPTPIGDGISVAKPTKW